MSDQTRPEIEILFERLRAGDEGAARAIVERHGEAVRWAINQLLRVRKPRPVASASDVWQETIWAFVEGAGQGRYNCASDRDLEKLLIGMARKKTAELVRRERAGCRDARRLAPAPVESLQLPAHADRRTASRNTAPAHDRMNDLLQHLPQSERELLFARHSGSSWTVLARERDTTPDAVRKRCVRAVKRLRSLMARLRRRDSQP